MRSLRFILIWLGLLMIWASPVNARLNSFERPDPSELPPFSEKALLPEGYVNDIQKERQEKFREIFLYIRKPEPQKRLVDAIFNVQLSREFREKYREKFGQLDTESIIYQRASVTSADPFRHDLNLISNEVLAQQRERRAFAEYMMKRLSEWHVDNYFKSEPNMRPVYELKEKLSKVNVQVTKQTKLEVQYNLSSNNLDIIVDNAYLDSKMSIEMDPSAFGPSRVMENKIILGKSFAPKYRLNNIWATMDGLVTLEWLTFHKPWLSTSYSTTAKYSSSGRVPGATRYLVGLNYLF